MEVKALIDQLYFCEAACNFCHTSCQTEADRDKLIRCMQLDEDCSSICRVSAIILERGSENSHLFLRLCSEICEMCASECELHSHHEHCRECAEACHACAEMCRSYIPAEKHY